MSAAPLEPAQPLQYRLLTVAEYAALGETDSGYTELIEGRLLLSPSPAPDHGFASTRLVLALAPVLPDGLEVLQDIDLDLGLAPPDAPGTVRRPDMMVIRADARRRVREEGGLLRASDAVLVVEVVSPGSVRIDRATKREEYADAGIPHYWIVDVAEPVSVLACHQTGALGYADGGEITGIFRATEPFPVDVDLATLR